MRAYMGILAYLSLKLDATEAYALIKRHRSEVLAEGLNASERQILTFALKLAADEMASGGDEFTDVDRDALASLRRMAEPVESTDEDWDA